MTLRSLLVVTLAAAVAGACSRDPKYHFDRAARYMAAKDYKNAIVEYRRAIQLDAKFGEARLKLADLYVQVNDPADAYREYVRAADLLPDDVDAQIKAGNFLLVAGRFDDARVRADKVLARHPTSVDGRILLGYAMAGLKNLDGAIGEIEKALVDAPDRSAAMSNLASLQMARGQVRQAEGTFRKAVEVAPRSAPARIALADFYLSEQRSADAEQELLKARTLEPANATAARALAILYLSTGRGELAEPILTSLVQTTPGLPARIMLADYYVARHRLQDAATVLAPLVAAKDPAPAVVTRSASVEYELGHRAEAMRRLAEFINRQPSDLAARIVHGRLLLSDRKPDEAAAEAQTALQIDGRSAPARRLLGDALAASGHPDAAVKAYLEVLRTTPSDVDTAVTLGRLQLANGRADAALDLAEQAMHAAPGRSDARLLATDALLTRNDIARAQTELQPLVAALPHSAAVQAAEGRLALKKGDRAAARAAFDRARTIDPASLDAFGGALDTEIADRQFDRVRAIAAQRIAAEPRDPRVLVMGARAYTAVGDIAKAEQALRAAIDADPDALAAYDLLGQIFVAERRLPQAQAEFEQIARRRPDSLGTETMIATLLQLQNRTGDAKAKYEAIVRHNPDAAVAANNLAWLYAEQGDNLDVALQLAQTAKSVVADSAEINDTLGWVYLKKNLAGLAMEPLQESVKKDPKNATYLYHLGLAYKGTGEKAKAVDAFERASKLKPDTDATAAARLVSELHD